MPGYGKSYGTMPKPKKKAAKRTSTSGTSRTTRPTRRR